MHFAYQQYINYVSHVSGGMFSYNEIIKSGNHHTPLHKTFDMAEDPNILKLDRVAPLRKSHSINTFLTHSLIYSVIFSFRIFKTLSTPNRKSLGAEMFTLHHVSHVTCLVSGVRCHMSGVRCNFFSWTKWWS